MARVGRFGVSALRDATMSTSTESLKQLLALAAKATPGDRVVVRNGLQQDCGVQLKNSHRHGGPFKDEDIGKPCHDCRFEAACSPDVIAELVNELLAAWEEIARLNKAVEAAWHDGFDRAVNS